VTSKTRRKRQGAASRDALLKVIATFKLVKALLLFGIGLGALELLNPAIAHQAERWVTAFAWRLGPRGLPVVQGGLARLQGSKLPMVEAVAFLYAALFAVEGVGLWMSRRWAEYLTIIATSSFVPFEVYELVRHVTWPRIVTLVINLLVVAYLVVKVRRRAS
jgi:hypothetical protein